MTKIGRNEPCPCGSGKKYKQCCRAADEAALVAATPPPPRPATRRFNPFDILIHDDDFGAELAEASNAVADLVRAGKLDEAERAAHALLERYPDVHDGYDRLGMVYEARGDNARAADSYRKAIAVIREWPDDYEPGFEQIYEKLVERLDPSGDKPAP
jgi:tetratricopeptide (TPR) repeat protein